MANVLIVYGTTDGQTRKVAERVAARLRDEGHTTSIHRAAQVPDDLQVLGYDAAIVAGGIRFGKHPKELIAWCKRHAAELQVTPGAFLSISMSAHRTTAPARREVAKHIADFVKRTSWTPMELLPVAGALKYSLYTPWIKLAMVAIALMTGGDTDTSRDYEYTDWAALERFARGFSAGLRGERGGLRPAAPVARA